MWGRVCPPGFGAGFGDQTPTLDLVPKSDRNVGPGLETRVWRPGFGDQGLVPKSETRVWRPGFGDQTPTHFITILMDSEDAIDRCPNGLDFP
jgi:hypothetical protein